MSLISDYEMRFLFDNHGVRGEIARLDESLKKLTAKPYPERLKKLLRELAASAVLVAATLKDGSEVMVQIQGGKTAPLKYALINIRQDLSFYGSAALKDGAKADDDAALSDLAGPDGIMVISVFPKEGTRWQGIVQLDPLSVGASLENYFRDSQQLPTRFFIWDSPQENRCGGIMLQIIPEIEGNLEFLEHTAVLAATLTPGELFNLAPGQILSRLYAHEEVRIFEAQELAFKCNCSKERCQNALLKLRREELLGIVSDGQAEMTCQHCGTAYRFSKDELAALLTKVSQ